MITLQNPTLLQLENTTEALWAITQATHETLTAAILAATTPAGHRAVVKAQAAYDAAHQAWTDAAEHLTAESDRAARQAALTDDEEEEAVAVIVAETWHAGPASHARLLQLVDLAGADITRVVRYL